VPIIAPIAMIKPATTIRFVKDGNVLKSALTISYKMSYKNPNKKITFSSSYWLITLNGLRALNDLKAFKDFNPVLPPPRTSITEVFKYI